MKPIAAPPDFELRNSLSLCLLAPLTPAADAWLDRHFARADEVQWFAGALVVEPRYLAPIVEGIRLDGLEVAR